MSDGNRGDHTKTGLIAGIIVAVLVASSFIGWGLWKTAEYEREAYDQAREYAAYTDEQIRQSCVRLAPVDQKNCTAKARHEQRDNERNEHDLVAQRKSALWAYIMGAAAVIGMGLSVIGVFLVWTTFAETRLANVISRQSAESAARDAKLSRNALIASDRAIISVDGIGQETGIPDDSPWLHFYFKLTNQGKSNAYGFQVFFTFSPDAVYRAKTRFSHNIDQICASGANVQYAVKVRRPKNYPTHVIGHISYSTMGDANFKSFFCFRIDGPPYKNGLGTYENLHLEKVDCEGLPALS